MMAGFRILVGVVIVALFAPFGLSQAAAQEGSFGSRKITMAFGGDVMFGRHVAGVVEEHAGKDPFAEVKSLLSQPDLAVINLENPVTEHLADDLAKKPPSGFTIRLSSPPKVIDTLKEAGIDVCVFANNHVHDADRTGLLETLNSLAAAGLSVAGAVQRGDPLEPTTVMAGPAEVQIFATTTFVNRRLKGKRNVARTNVNSLDDEFCPRLREARKQSPNALIVVSIHWGPENKKDPVAKQQKLARRLIRAGADVIMGHHTHVVHPVEIYQGGAIFYSLGNLLFDQRGRHQRRSTVAHVEWEQDSETSRWVLSTVKLHPILRPRDMSNMVRVVGKVAKSTLNGVRRRSRSNYGTSFEWVEDVLVWRAVKSTSPSK